MGEKEAEIFNGIPLQHVRTLPTSIDKVSESLYRSYMALQKVKELLRQEAPYELILELIRDMYSQGQIEKTVKEIMGE